MNSLFLVSTRVITLLLLLSLPSCFCTSQTSQRNLWVVDEKTRLGSTPPSCHNKCNACHPCMAVQVPTMPNREPVRPDLDWTGPVSYFDLPHNKYSNYKPLGWKCRCGDHLFNP